MHIFDSFAFIRSSQPYDVQFLPFLPEAMQTDSDQLAQSMRLICMLHVNREI